MTFTDKIKHGLTGFEKYFDLPAFSIDTNDLFFGKSRICAYKSKPVLTVSLVSDTDDFSRDRVFLSNLYINGKQILGSSFALLVSGIDFLDIKPLAVVFILNT